MSGSGGGTDYEGDRLREVTARAIRRLDLLEYAIVGAAALLAVIAGGIVAFLVTAATSYSFTTAWIAASLLFFVVPAGLARWSNRERPPPDGEEGRPSA